MITGVACVAVLVSDPNESAVWYHDKLGFEILENVEHSVFVKPRDSQTSLLHLCGPCDAWEGDKPGGRTGVWLQCGPMELVRRGNPPRLLPRSPPDAVEEACRELKEKGVEFSEDLTTTEWGKYAIMRDPDGNEFEIS
jgi:catechol 2,3-dioxygenase-like lactoylglutathione lyase family enzyme